MSVGEFCTREVTVVDRDDTVREAARLMRNEHVGDVVVVRQGRQGPVPVGILTDRDLVLEVLAMDADPDAITTGDALTGTLVTANENDELLATLAHMRSRAVRRMPVVDDDGTLVGIITVDDYIGLFAEQMQELVALMVRQHVREEERRPAG